jgi:hypothetical protein
VPGLKVSIPFGEFIGNHDFIVLTTGTTEESLSYRFLRDTDEFRTSMLQHPVQEADNLGRLLAFRVRSWCVADHAFVAADVRLHQWPPVMAGHLLPNHPTVLAMSCGCQARCVGAFSPVSLGTVPERGGTMTAASGWHLLTAP